MINYREAPEKQTNNPLDRNKAPVFANYLATTCRYLPVIVTRIFNINAPPLPVDVPTIYWFSNIDIVVCPEDNTWNQESRYCFLRTDLSEFIYEIRFLQFYYFLSKYLFHLYFELFQFYQNVIYYIVFNWHKLLFDNKNHHFFKTSFQGFQGFFTLGQPCKKMFINLHL